MLFTPAVLKAYAALKPLPAVYCGLRRIAELPAPLRKVKPMGSPGKKLVTQLLFKPGYLLGKGGLGEVKPACRLGYVVIFRNLQDIY